MSTILDFSSARFKHINWIFRLRSFLDGKEILTAEQVLSHTNCELGKWIYSSGKTKYGHLPNFPAFESLHQNLHETIVEIIELRKNGRHEEAEKIYTGITKTSDELIGLLYEIEKAAK